MKTFASVVELTAQTLKAGEKVRLDRYYADGDLVEGLIYEIQSSGSADGYIDHAIVNGNIAKLIGTDIRPEHFGAKGDGTTDDYNSLNAYMVSAFTVIDGRGKTYRTSQSLSSTTYKHIKNLNLFATASMTEVITTTGVLVLENSTTDCNSLAEVGVRSRENALYRDVEIKNAQSSSTNAAYGIHATLTAKTKGIIVFDNVKVDGVTHTVTGGSIGDNEGSARAIRVKYFGACDQCVTYISNATCFDVFGQEGDAIVVADEASTVNSSFYLAGLHIEGYNRRGVKIQADNVTINGITKCKDIDGTDPKAINGEAAIDTAGTGYENIHINDVSIECLSLSQAVRIADTVGACSATNINVKVTATGSATPEVLLQNNNDNLQLSAWNVNTNHFICISDAGNSATDYCKISDWQVSCTSASSLNFINMAGSAFNHDISNITLTGNQENMLANSTHTLTDWVVDGVKIFAAAGKGRFWSNSTGLLSGVVFQNLYSNGTNVPFSDSTNLSGDTLTGAIRRNNIHSNTSSGFRQNINDTPISVYPQTTIADPSGGATIDAEARTAISALIDRLQANNIIL